jgi:hypothetical protein
MIWVSFGSPIPSNTGSFGKSGHCAHWVRMHHGTQRCKWLVHIAIVVVYIVVDERGRPVVCPSTYSMRAGAQRLLENTDSRE